MKFVVIGIGTGFSPSNFVSACLNSCTNALNSSSSTRCSYQKDKWAKSGNLPKICALPEIGIFSYHSKPHISNLNVINYYNN